MFLKETSPEELGAMEDLVVRRTIMKGIRVGEECYGESWSREKTYERPGRWREGGSGSWGRDMEILEL